MVSRKMLALDIGTSSVRTFQGKFDGELLRLEEIHRFYHVPVHTPFSVQWDLQRISENIDASLQKAIADFGMPDSMSLDSWLSLIHI